jgi:hypothetical protein
VDGEINRAFQKEEQVMKERGKKVLALIPLNLDGFLFSADCQNAKKAEITSRVAAATHLTCVGCVKITHSGLSHPSHPKATSKPHQGLLIARG